MAQFRGGSFATSAKQKLHKSHGPKRHMFKDYKPMIHQFAKAGLLTKYNDYESFALSCTTRGVKSGIAEMWIEFRCLPRDKQNEYLKNIRENSVAAVAKIEEKKKAAKKSDEVK